jgi:hypothetical protein
MVEKFGFRHIKNGVEQAYLSTNGIEIKTERCKIPFMGSLHRSV